MTQTLKKAFQQARKLTPKAQNAIGRVILDLTSERKWDELFATKKSQDLLARLADEAWAQYERGETRPLEDLWRKPGNSRRRRTASGQTRTRVGK